MCGATPDVETLADATAGFEWISWKSFILGFIESYGYRWDFALIWAPIYNFIVSKDQRIS